MLFASERVDCAFDSPVALAATLAAGTVFLLDDSADFSVAFVADFVRLDRRGVCFGSGSLLADSPVDAFAGFFRRAGRSGGSTDS